MDYAQRDAGFIAAVIILIAWVILWYYYLLGVYGMGASYIPFFVGVLIIGFVGGVFLLRPLEEEQPRD